MFNSTNYSTFNQLFNIQPSFNIQPIIQHSTNYSTFNQLFNIQSRYSIFNPAIQHSIPLFNIQPLFMTIQHSTIIQHSIRLFDVSLRSTNQSRIQTRTNPQPTRYHHEKTAGLNEHMFGRVVKTRESKFAIVRHRAL